MKKFEPEVFVNAWGVQVLDMVESKRGEYVEVKEAEKLELLNKEMLDLLKKAEKKIQYWSINADIGGSASREILAELQSIIAKAEETA